MTPSRAHYRADIEGLRALAIAGVVAHHAFASYVPGGFFGVDIFFVISGFLITSIIANDLEAGRFDLRDFYARRIRRLGPALLAVLAATYAAGWLLLTAEELAQLGKHMAAAALFVSNMAYAQESGYFNAANESKPLLHLWSLGVEAQFYLIWPLAMAVFPWRSRVFPAVLLMAGLCLLLLGNGSPSKESAFFTTHLRLWEILAGAIIALGMKHRAESPVHAAAANMAAWVGIVLIALSFVGMDKKYAFPHYAALMPVLGAALLILAGGRAWVNRAVLAAPPCVQVGHYSYPIYLWHWVLLSFAYVIGGAAPGGNVKSAAVITSLGLAWLSYHGLEKPLRRRSHMQRHLVLMMLGFAVVGFVTYVQQGFPSRKAALPQIVNEGDTGHTQFFDYIAQHFYACDPHKIAWQGPVPNFSFHRCAQSRTDRPISVALVGDSHAEHLYIGLAEQAKEANIAYYMFHTDGTITGDSIVQSIVRSVADDPQIQTVLLTLNWTQKQGILNPQRLQAELDQLIGEFARAGKTLYLLEDVPIFSFYPARCQYSRLLRHSNICTENREVLETLLARYQPMLEAMKRHYPQITILPLGKYLCDSGQCTMAMDGRLFYRDEQHLGIFGSQYVGQKLMEEYPHLLESRPKSEPQEQ